MSAPFVIVVVVAALALGLSAFALWVALGARKVAREAHEGVTLVANRLPRKRPAPEAPAEPHVERREQDSGPPEGEPERRGAHRADAPRYSRLRASADAREAHVQQPADDVTAQIPAVQPEQQLATTEHPAPTSTYRRPPPPLPRPGQIGGGQ